MKKLFLYLFVTIIFVIFSSTIVFMEVAATNNWGVLNPKLESFIDSNPNFVLLVLPLTIPGYCFWLKTAKEYHKVYGVNLLK